MKKYNSSASERALFRNILDMGDNVQASWAAMVIQPDGMVEILGLQRKEDFSFDRFKYAMGMERGTCLEMIEASTLTMLADVSIACFVDEDGINKGLEPNPCATVFAGQSVYGPVLFINKDLFMSMDKNGPDYNTAELSVIDEVVQAQVEGVLYQHDTVLHGIENGVFGSANEQDPESWVEDPLQIGPDDAYLNVDLLEDDEDEDNPIIFASDDVDTDFSEEERIAELEWRNSIREQDDE